MEFFLTFCFGIITGTCALYLLQKVRLATVRELSKEIFHQAEKKAHSLKEQAEASVKIIEQKNQISSIKFDNERRQKEEKLERKIEESVQKLIEQEKKEKQLRQKDELLQQAIQEAKNVYKQAEQQLSQIAGFSKEEAKNELLAKERSAIERECQEIYLKKTKAFDETLEEESRHKIIACIERIAEKQTPVSPLLYVDLKNEELKSRIIGREGRNIKAFEQFSGVTLLIDDSPDVISISSFDPSRRHIAKRALAILIEDGRIHPSRIEEVLQRCEENFEAELLKLAQEKAESARVFNLHPEILRLLGKLHLRSSHGQNVLDHSVEVSHLMGMMCAELKLNEPRARRIGLLHDIGKAIPAESGLSHAICGMQFARKYGEKEDVANGIGCHHQEIEALSLEGALCKAADSLSARRMGARSEQIEKYVNRLQSLEDLALEFSGVERAYALQAGRELRVFVKPESIDDVKALELAQRLAKKIETTQTYSGKIQVTIIREKKIVEFAS